MASSPHAGSAGYYAVGRVDYPIALADALPRELGLDGSGRLLDVACGPGKFTLQMAPLFEQATGVDADRDMLAEAGRRATQAGVGNVQWLHLGAEELLAGLLVLGREFRAVIPLDGSASGGPGRRFEPAGPP
jgi:2-polyprenyl-3-methyl-5-hydroxy-6-metoxy-1,4-benzoquinol methylase